LGLGASAGSRGSRASQRSSGTKDEAFIACYHAIAGRVLQHALSVNYPPTPGDPVVGGHVGAGSQPHEGEAADEETPDGGPA
jgi:hypothetical protein